MLLTLAATVAGLLLDPRAIAGQPAWLKPAKFALSSAMYTFTLAWLLTFVQGHRRLVGLVSWVIALGFTLEMVVIIGQAIRGTTSHFNISTPLDGALFSLMGSMIVVIWVMTVLAAVLLLRQRLPDAAFAWALRLGLVVVLVGAAEGFVMTSLPSPSQRAALAAGQRPTSFGAHSVGVDDGGRGLPVTGWSLEGGDLRIGHFVGLHAMQVLPFVGWWISRRFGRLGQGHRTALVVTAALGYLGLVALLTWQALRGQPLVYPDSLTLAALAGLVAGVALAAGVILSHGQTHPTPALPSTAR
ncbi:MAG: hypothetical protein KIT87_18875 [Anaerolineae bacterium]|nr:hypothetical protein [Anaerolineae bacterium]